jgi:hypothetical protein
MAVLQFLILLFFIMVFASVGALVFIRLVVHGLSKLPTPRPSSQTHNNL